MHTMSVILQSFFIGLLTFKLVAQVNTTLVGIQAAISFYSHLETHKKCVKFTIKYVL